MNEVIIKEQENIQEIVPEAPAFKGYSLEELRYQRALVAIRKDFSKAKMLRQLETVRNRGFFGKSRDESKMSHLTGLASKVVNGLGYIDYALMGVSAYTAVRKVFKIFRKKK